MSILLYSSHFTSRIRYIIEDVLLPYLSIPINTTSDMDEYLGSTQCKINYSQARLDTKELWIPNVGLLHEIDICDMKPTISIAQNMPILFDCTKIKADLSFDVFSAVFWLLTRYEEYQEFEPDAHGRFAAKQSLLREYVRRPLVDEWLMLLRNALSTRYPSLVMAPISYTYLPTFDIDLAWAYRGRSIQRKLGTLLRDAGQLNWRQALTRLRAWVSPHETDPYHTYHWITQIHNQEQVHFFFLLADYARFDTNVHWQYPPLKRLIQYLGQQYAIGIHPSYQSNEMPEKLLLEKQRLEILLDKNITTSRQHFLKLRFPHTYQQLIKAGIQHDYSMGYADEVGFRAGTARSFKWYDLSIEKSSDLYIHPFQVMDVTLRDYLALSPEESLSIIKEMQINVQRYGGTFCTLWHNSAYTEQAWKDFYNNMIQMLRSA